VTDANDLAERWFGSAWTIDRREFSDGDTRTVITHSVGVSSTCYIQVKVWVERESVWIEYHEGDTRRFRTTMPLHEFDPAVDPSSYVWGDKP